MDYTPNLNFNNVWFDCMHTQTDRQTDGQTWGQFD